MASVEYWLEKIAEIFEQSNGYTGHKDPDVDESTDDTNMTAAEVWLEKIHEWVVRRFA